MGSEMCIRDSFYTTAASRIARGLFPNAVRCDEVIALCSREA